jgi:transcriptional regulator with XRE-family HTH domain
MSRVNAVADIWSVGTFNFGREDSRIVTPHERADARAENAEASDKTLMAASVRGPSPGSRVVQRTSRAGREVALAQAHARQIEHRLATGISEARRSAGLSQAEVARRAGISQPSLSELERERGGSSSLEVWAVVAAAVGRRFAAFLEMAPGADLPRDHEHLKRQRLVIETARRGGWRPQFEVAIDPLATRSRSIDVVLTRRATNEMVIVEVWDWLADVGDAIRSSDAKVASVRRKVAGRPETPPTITELWVLRGTHRNRQLVRDFAAIFDVRFPASSAAWLRALTEESKRAPTTAGLLWSDVRGDRLLTRRFRRERDGPTD